MNKSVVFMFSGQGLQYYTMGKELYHLDTTFRKWMLRLDGIFQDMTGESVVKLLYHSGRKKGEVFERTIYTHPAIFMVEYSLAQVLIERGIYPEHVLGYSMGEFASGAVAGIMSYEEIFHCLIKQAQMLEAYCPGGGMLAILKDKKLFDEADVLQETRKWLVSITALIL